MRLAVFDDYRIGVVRGESLYDVTPTLPERWRNTPYAMNELIGRFQELRGRIEESAQAGPALSLGSVRLRPPVPAPLHVFAAPVNYRAHQAEMAARIGESTEGRPTARELGFFIKASGSIIGPADAIQLPNRPGREFHHEAELAAVIGREARAVSQSRALDYVFGYTCLMDVTMRTAGKLNEERVLRKSFETFTPTGPVLVTADEVGDPNDLEISLWVNDELRQHSRTSNLIVSIPELLEQASQVLTLRPGDVYATGTPEGVGPIQPGDRVSMAIERVGEMSLSVEQRAW